MFAAVAGSWLSPVQSVNVSALIKEEFYLKWDHKPKALNMLLNTAYLKIFPSKQQNLFRMNFVISS